MEYNDDTVLSIVAITVKRLEPSGHPTKFLRSF